MHERAANYLGWLTVLVLATAGVVDLHDFVWPGNVSLATRVEHDLELLRQNLYPGAFVLTELSSASPYVKLFVTILLRQVEEGTQLRKQNYQWIRAMRLAAAGDAEGKTQLAQLREKAEKTFKSFSPSPNFDDSVPLLVRVFFLVGPGLPMGIN